MRQQAEGGRNERCGLIASAAASDPATTTAHAPPWSVPPCNVHACLIQPSVRDLGGHHRSSLPRQDASCQLVRSIRAPVLYSIHAEGSSKMQGRRSCGWAVILPAAVVWPRRRQTLYPRLGRESLPHFLVPEYVRTVAPSTDGSHT
jgi:hypothetical protein